MIVPLSLLLTSCWRKASHDRHMVQAVQAAGAAGPRGTGGTCGGRQLAGDGLTPLGPLLPKRVIAILGAQPLVRPGKSRESLDFCSPT